MPTVYVAEVNAAGHVVGNDLQLGSSQPGGFAATPTGFGDYLWDGDSLGFGAYGNGQPVADVLLMDHRAKVPGTLIHGQRASSEVSSR